MQPMHLFTNLRMYVVIMLVGTFSVISILFSQFPVKLQNQAQSLTVQSLRDRHVATDSRIPALCAPAGVLAQERYIANSANPLQFPG